MILLNYANILKFKKETNTMKQVAPLRYDVIFKKAFSVPEVMPLSVIFFIN
jgi:hypothetical protein